MKSSDQMKEKMDRSLDRRRFLKWLGVCSLGLSPLAFARPIQNRIFARGLASAAVTRPLMGTLVTVTVLHPSQECAYEAMEAAFSEMERLIAILSRHADDTPVAYLNRTGRLSEVPPVLHAVMNRAESFDRLTHGRFDISVKPILDLLEPKGQKPLPSYEEIRSALKRVGARYVLHTEREIRFLKEGMGITLDAVAKGYIVDRAIAELERRGIRHALINAGGDIRALGDKGEGRPWRIAIQDPWDQNRILQIIPLRDWAVATSGDYENFFDPARKYHHIIDPETGFSPTRLTSVSVTAPTLADADALATAAFIPSSASAHEFIHIVPGAEALWIDREKAMEKTSGWPV
jgi:thiamine biosynthesis lipoprotein